MYLYPHKGLLFSDVRSVATHIMINTVDTIKITLLKSTLIPVRHNPFKTLYVGLALKITFTM